MKLNALFRTCGVENEKREEKIINKKNGRKGGGKFYYSYNTTYYLSFSLHFPLKPNKGSKRF